MKFELVEFYEVDKDKPFKGKKGLNNMVGTIHVYSIDCQLDIRGIRVCMRGNSIYFHLPKFRAIDEDGKEVVYPHLRWTNQKTHEEFMDFLHREVKPVIKQRLMARH